MTTLAKEKTLNLLTEETLPAGFVALRTAAQARLLEQGLPKAKDEEYKFTAITKRLQGLQHPERAEALNLTAAFVDRFRYPQHEGDILVFNNGTFDPKHSRIASSIEVSEVQEDDPLFGSIVKLEADPFICLNTAQFVKALRIHVAANTQVEKPILLLHFHQLNKGASIPSRILIQLEKHAEAHFVEQSVHLDEQATFVNMVTEVRAEAGAQGSYNRLQIENEDTIAVNNFAADIHRDAVFTHSCISLQGGMLRNNLFLNLKESGCTGNMFGLYALTGKSHVDNHTNVDHMKAHADSNELYKGIVADQARAVFNGKIFVRQDAQKTNAFQQNNNILLSDEATVNTKPQLEIWADDVKCSHGCTIGQLDEEALFYLQARGIDKVSARALLLYAFAGEVLERIPVASFRDHLIELLEERLLAKS